MVRDSRARMLVYPRFVVRGLVQAGLGLVNGSWFVVWGLGLVRGSWFVVRGLVLGGQGDLGMECGSWFVRACTSLL